MSADDDLEDMLALVDAGDVEDEVHDSMQGAWRVHMLCELRCTRRL